MATASGPVLRIVDTRTAERHVGRYAARLRWRCAVDPDWEIDTRHPGFETWRQAACFANGLTEEGASMLFLQDGALLLQLVNGREVAVDERETVIWQRASSGNGTMPDDLGFVRAAIGAGELTAMGLDGPLTPICFGVDDVGGSSRLDVRVSADVRRRSVLVTLVVPKESGEEETTVIGGYFRDLPQA
jgi:hypothetical protein